MAFGLSRGERPVLIEDMDRFLASKGAAGWSRASLDTLAASLRSCFRYAQYRRWFMADIAASVRGPRIFAQEGLPRSASWQDVQRLRADSAGAMGSASRLRWFMRLRAEATFGATHQSPPSDEGCDRVCSGMGVLAQDRRYDGASWG